ncbi:MAG TPA: hypothetical protein PLU88_14830 [Armatimonadota bacterium]|nr:hypothetical protein [Armatimonadota bacterium]
MKKTLTICLVLVGVIFFFSAPLPAEDKSLEERVSNLEKKVGGIEFFGSVRVATFYNDVDTATGDDETLTWDNQLTSRIGARFTRDKIFGMYELSVDDDAGLSTRRLFATYDMGWGSLKIGQDYTPIGLLNYSNQVYADDANLITYGNPAERRTVMVQLAVKGFKIAFVEDRGSSKMNATSGDVDSLTPKLEVSYRLSNQNYFVDVFGGFLSYSVDDVIIDATNFGDKTVNCWITGVGGGITLDPVFVRGLIYYAQNGKNLDMAIRDAAGAQFDTTGSVVDETNAGGYLVVGSKVGKCTVEAGFGYGYSQLDDAVGTYGDDKNTIMAYYLNTTIPVYGSFIIVPEIGVLDYLDDSFGDDEKKATRYIGAKWQIDF